MKIFIYCVILSTFLLANEAAFFDAKYCKSCHRDQVKLWERSWHSNNHAELYNAILDIVANEQTRLKEEVIAECSKCHNPNLSIKNMDNNYLYSKIFDITNQKVEEIDEIINSTDKLSGISCYVCHKIDKIKENRAPHEVGSLAVEWIKEARVFSGPFDDVLDEYHANVKRDFFTENNNLCLICHNGIATTDKNGRPNEISAYTTGDEMTSNEKSCADCHMSNKFDTVAASGGSEAIIRQARSHFFSGAHDIKQIRGGVLLSFDEKTSTLNLQNTAPHMSPTGFGGRMIEIKIKFLDASGEILASHTEEIGPKYEKNGRPALKYLADILAFDNSLAPNEKREIKLNLPKNAKNIEVQMLYYYINPELIREYDLKLKESTTGPILITTKNYEIKK